MFAKNLKTSKAAQRLLTTSILLHNYNCVVFVGKKATLLDSNIKFVYCSDKDGRKTNKYFYILNKFQYLIVRHFKRLKHKMACHCFKQVHFTYGKCYM